MSHFDERTKNTMREWNHHSEEVQLWILVDPTEAEYYLEVSDINKGCTTNSEMYIILSCPNHWSHYERKELIERQHRQTLTSHHPGLHWGGNFRWIGTESQAKKAFKCLPHTCYRTAYNGALKEWTYCVTVTSMIRHFIN